MGHVGEQPPWVHASIVGNNRLVHPLQRVGSFFPGSSAEYRKMFLRQCAERASDCCLRVRLHTLPCTMEVGEE